ncbi:deoxyuridine 5'-triphosphate nucleotidohydrolase [candidate division WOR_3 bacterium SM23_42]|uniref:Deoxyuridine 5'-triphosphate nucleotidohydrolase n=1 Tax=candidate division WOR_3 bacterium SM23_42 TaxID=1703779 RepID=A0A0S8FXG7_UNCW3|nr:MAG: deoxyuridine 5'-triphosphate nucleotidohydrolase [candidate division WOR_3 bacterium SM23_42]
MAKRGVGKQETLEVRIRGDLVPKYQSAQAAGCDLYAAIKKEVIIVPHGFAMIPTGIRIEIPMGYEAQVRPRSGLAKKYGIGVLNTPGTIDADYRGEIKVILFNQGTKPFKVKARDRIAQLVFKRVERARFVRVKRLKRTKRQTGGLGHTGI